MADITGPGIDHPYLQDGYDRTAKNSGSPSTADYTGRASNQVGKMMDPLKLFAGGFRNSVKNLGGGVSMAGSQMLGNGRSDETRPISTSIIPAAVPKTGNMQYGIRASVNELGNPIGTGWTNSLPIYSNPNIGKLKPAALPIAMGFKNALNTLGVRQNSQGPGDSFSAFPTPDEQNSGKMLGPYNRKTGK